MYVTREKTNSRAHVSHVQHTATLLDFDIIRQIISYPETDALGNDVIGQGSECWAVRDGVVVVPHDLGRPLRLSFEDDVRLVLRYSHLLPAFSHQA